MRRGASVRFVVGRLELFAPRAMSLQTVDFPLAEYEERISDTRPLVLTRYVFVVTGLREYEQLLAVEAFIEAG